MDLTTLVERLRDRHEPAILTFDKGQTVRRAHATVFEDVRATVGRLASWGVRPGMRVGIRAQNCYEWLVHDLALIELRAVSVAFTDDFAPARSEELCDRYALSLMLVSSSERGRHPTDARHVATIDGDNGTIRARDQSEPATDTGFDRPFLIFSSGSSGGVKGMILNRSGVEANVDAFVKAIQAGPGDRWLLFLPISNFQQRMMYYAGLWHGFDLILTDPVRLFHAMRDLAPTILVAPPSFYEGFETRFHNQRPWKRLATALAADLALQLPLGAIRSRLAAHLFADAQGMLGGRIRIMVTGMAPIKRATLDLFRRMQLPLFETYGLAECGSVALNAPGGHKLGSVGRVLPGVHVEFRDDGEIVIHRDQMVTLGYFQCAEGESERTFVGGNRVATGDIGRLDADGYLHLVGRKKEIIIAAGGEKLHPEALEAEIDSCVDVAKSVVIGDQGAPFLIAVVLPKNPGDRDARKRIEDHIDHVGGRRKSVSIGRVVFTDLAFSRENGFLRPNLKLDRRRIAEHFKSAIAAPNP